MTAALPGMPEATTWLDLSAERRAQIAARFATKLVEVDSGCMIFTGAVSSPDGYGRVTITDRGVSRTFSAHRLSCLIAGIDLAPGVVVEHRCNEPLCVRVDVDHLIASTQSQNLAWAVACGRAAGPRQVVDSTKRVLRSRAVRNLALTGWSQREYHRILDQFGSTRDTADANQLALFEV